MHRLRLFHFVFFRLLRVPRSSTDPIQMQSSIALTQGKKCKERKIIVKKMTVK